MPSPHDESSALRLLLSPFYEMLSKGPTANRFAGQIIQAGVIMSSVGRWMLQGSTRASAGEVVADCHKEHAERDADALIEMLIARQTGIPFPDVTVKTGDPNG